MSHGVPDPVLAYFATDSALYRSQLRQEHADLDAQLASPRTRQALLRWLGAEDRDPDEPHVIAEAVGHLRAAADASEAAIIRPFTLHQSAHVRRAAYEFLLTLYFPTGNRPALLALLQTMLIDHDDVVRAAAARHVERAGAADDLDAYLRQWLRSAGDRGWTGTESHRLISELEGGR